MDVLPDRVQLNRAIEIRAVDTVCDILNNQQVIAEQLCTAQPPGHEWEVPGGCKPQPPSTWPVDQSREVGASLNDVLLIRS